MLKVVSLLPGALSAVLLAGGVACDGSPVPECAAGQVRYAGRPPPRLFSYDRTCRADCFSFPSGACDRECEEIELNEQAGGLLAANDRLLALSDAVSLGDSRALVYAFSFYDEAGGEAPDGWSFLTAGPASYQSDQVFGTARFIIETAVYAVEPVTVDGVSGFRIVEPVSDVLHATPGRLDVLEASEQRIAGRFYLSYETPTEQPQGQVLGCFDLGVRGVYDLGGSTARLLGP